MGQGISQEQQEQAQSIVADVCGTFAKEYELATMIALVQAIKNGDSLGHEREEESKEPERRYRELKLDGLPDPSEPLRTGSIVKQGAVRKNWLSRYFVAKNKAGNYEIDYYNQEGGKLKGTVNCAGYRVGELTAIERELYQAKLTTHGEHAIVLRPYDDRRRTWIFIADNEEEKREWEAIFRNACWRSHPQREADPILRTAFKLAYQRTRAASGVYSSWSYNMPEGQLLCCFITELVKQQVFPEGALDEVPKTTANSFFKDAVVTPVTAAWSGAVSGAKAGKPALIDTVRKGLEPLVSAQEELKGQIVDAVGGIANPIITEKGGSMLSPVLDVVFQPLVGAYIAAFEGLVEDMRERADRIKTDTNALQREVDSGLRASSSNWRGPREKAGEQLRSLCDSGLNAVAEILGDGMSADVIYNECMRDLETVCQMAYSTWRNRVEAADDKTAAVDEAMNGVLNDAVDDIKLWVRERVNAVLLGVIEPVVSEEVIPPALEPVEALQEAVPETVQALIDLPTETEGIVNEMVEGTVASILEAALETQMQRIENECKAAMS